MATSKPFKVLMLLILLAVIAENEAAPAWLSRVRSCLGSCVRGNPREETRPATMTLEEKLEIQVTDDEFARYQELLNRRMIMTKTELKTTTKRLKNIYKSQPKLLSEINLEEFEKFKKKKMAGTKSSESEQWFLYAVNAYTGASGNVNLLLRNVAQKTSICRGVEVICREDIDPHLILDESLTQAELIQNYILTKPEEYEAIYRFEKPYPKFEENFSKVDTVTMFPTFASSTTLGEGFSEGLPTTNRNIYKTKYTFIGLTNSRRIADISEFPSQEEVLFPLGTQFLIKEFTKHDDGTYSVLLEQHNP